MGKCLISAKSLEITKLGQEVPRGGIGYANHFGILRINIFILGILSIIGFVMKKKNAILR